MVSDHLVMGCCIDRLSRQRFSVTGNLVVHTFGEADFTGFGPGGYFRVTDQLGTTPFVDRRAFAKGYVEHFPLKLLLIVPNGA